MIFSHLCELLTVSLSVMRPFEQMPFDKAFMVLRVPMSPGLWLVSTGDGPTARCGSEGRSHPLRDRGTCTAELVKLVIELVRLVKELVKPV